MRHVVFIGFMGAGKSTAAREAAAVLRTGVVDVDEEIEARVGKPLAQVFEEDGEAAFRALEQEVTLEYLGAPGVDVVALGGGAISSAAVREALKDELVIWVEAPLRTAWERCAGSGRPLARDRDAFEALYNEREPIYAELADAILPGDRSNVPGPLLAALEDLPPDTKVVWAASGSGDHPVYLGGGLVSEQRFWPPTVEGRRFVVTDGNVGELYGQAIESAAPRVSVVPGEGSKTVAHAEIVWTELARAGMTRADVLVALGGGVVGDLAGFCAATYQRGTRYVQVPTTLVAQVDSAYGGKTGVDLPEAKNYVGAYHQPVAVLADPALLSTLPPAELAAGYAEVVKTGLIAGGSLWDRVRAGADPASPDVILWCLRTKLRIVAEDERDAGLRQVLNLGHTVAHAIEAASGYARYRHGEAVALGLLAELRLSGQDSLRDEVRELLEAHGLPTSLDGVDPEQVAQATLMDKKRRGSAPVPFVLLSAPGRPMTGCSVEPAALAEALEEVVR